MRDSFVIFSIERKTHHFLLPHTHTVKCYLNILPWSPLKRKSHHSLLQQHKGFCFMTVRIFYRFGQHQPEKKANTSAALQDPKLQNRSSINGDCYGMESCVEKLWCQEWSDSIYQ
ncbi:hypothetical protein L1887_28703 [Cichorium endivia]|nr:hypothetical protein L1887_28703 [Cichorium endivia]